MSEQIKAIIEKHIREMNKGNIDELDELLTIDTLRHAPPFPDFKGIEESKQTVTNLWAPFPDHHQVIDEIIIQGGKSVVRYTFRGTNMAPHPLVPTPTGKEVVYTVCWVAHWAGGKVIEDWVYMDSLGMLQQLGVIPTIGT